MLSPILFSSIFNSSANVHIPASARGCYHYLIWSTRRLRLMTWAKFNTCPLIIFYLWNKLFTWSNQYNSVIVLWWGPLLCVVEFTMFLSTHHRCRLWGQPGRVPPIIEKLQCIHQLLTPFAPKILFAPNIFDKSMPVAPSKGRPGRPAYLQINPAIVRLLCSFGCQVGVRGEQAEEGDRIVQRWPLMATCCIYCRCLQQTWTSTWTIWHISRRWLKLTKSLAAAYSVSIITVNVSRWELRRN